VRPKRIFKDVNIIPESDRLTLWLQADGVKPLSALLLLNQRKLYIMKSLESSTPRSSTGDVKSAKRTVQILEILAGSKTSMSLSAISKAGQIPKSSLHGILKTLVDQGWINFIDENNSYVLGLKSLKVGARFLDTDELTNGALLYMSQFRDTFGETINFGRFDGYNVIYLSSFESSKNPRKYSRIGRSIPAYATSMGKAILAQKPFEEVEKIYPSSFTKLTSKTVPDLSALKIELTQCRKDGWAIEHGQSSDGYSCIAVALNDQYPPINSLSVSLQTKALTNKYRDAVLTELFSLAKKINT